MPRKRKATTPPKRKKPRRESVSLLHHYDGQRRRSDMAIVDTDDPYATVAHEEAKLVLPSHTEAISEVVRSWQAPAPKRITVIQRSDILIRMLARDQIDETCYRAARDYEGLFEIANGRSTSTMSFETFARLDTKRIANFGINDLERAAAARLRFIDSRIIEAYGKAGITVVHGVLLYAKMIRLIAEENGKSDRQTVTYWRELFVKCLMLMTEVMGYSTPGAFLDLTGLVAKE